MIRQLAVEAELREMRVGELISAVIIAVTKGDLFQLVLSGLVREFAHRHDYNHPHVYPDPLGQR
jgi:hypothetical protein